MRIIGLVTDLLDQSKIKNSLSQHDVSFSKSAEESNADVYLVDLRRPTALSDISELAGAVLVGFGSHVDVERTQKALAGGCTVAVARSRFFARMNEVIEEALLKAKS